MMTCDCRDFEVWYHKVWYQTWGLHARGLFPQPVEAVPFRKL